MNDVDIFADIVELSYLGYLYLGYLNENLGKFNDTNKQTISWLLEGATKEDGEMVANYHDGERHYANPSHASKLLEGLFGGFLSVTHT